MGIFLSVCLPLYFFSSFVSKWWVIMCHLYEACFCLLVPAAALVGIYQWGTGGGRRVRRISTYHTFSYSKVNEMLRSPVISKDFQRLKRGSLKYLYFVDYLACSRITSSSEPVQETSVTHLSSFRFVVPRLFLKSAPCSRFSYLCLFVECSDTLAVAL